MKLKVPEIDVNERINKDLATLIKPWRLPKPQKYALTNAGIVDAKDGKLVEGLTVITAEGKILDLVPNGTSLDPEEYVIVDCSGKFICPGLFDFHVHCNSSPGETGLERLMNLPKTTGLMRVGKNLEYMLARGFTSIRDCGGAERYISDAIEEGVIHGPRLFFCGHAISQTGGHGDMCQPDLPSEAYDSCGCHINYIGKVADGVPDCLKAAREEMRRGASFLKIMGGGGVASPTDRLTNTQYTAEEIQAFVKVADSYHTFVTAHAYTPESIQHCINNGVRGIEHGNMIDDATAKLMAEKNVYLTPTLITYKVMCSDQFSAFLPESGREKNETVLKAGLLSLLTAKNHGVKVCYGSDLLGSLSGYQTGEFFLRGKVLSAAEVLRSATVTPAECLGVDQEIGQVKKGFNADLLVLEKNPLEDIAILDEPEKNLLAVIKGGVVFHSAWEGLKGEA